MKLEKITRTERSSNGSIVVFLAQRIQRTPKKTKERKKKG